MSHVIHATPFVWAVGIEDTIIGTPLRRGRRLDEYTLTGHLDRWRSDLDLAKEAGATAIRYGIPWHRSNPGPGRYDWEHADRALAYAAEDLGLDVILDLVHYGTPDWLEGAFCDPSYPSAIAEYAAEAATRYRGVVASYTPLNEPLVTASFCGLRGIWPPYRSSTGYSRQRERFATPIRTRGSSTSRRSSSTRRPMSRSPRAWSSGVSERGCRRISSSAG
jgi:beta-glucosidase